MAEKMRAAWWWIDRWRKSTAYTDMTLAQQGAYRNLLDELWLRDGLLPNDDRILAKISGDAFSWIEVRTVVMARFYLTDAGWRHETHDEVAGQSKTFKEAQIDAAKARMKNAPRDAKGRLISTRVDQPGSPAGIHPEVHPSVHPPSPSPSPSQTPKKKNPPTPRPSKGGMVGFSDFYDSYPRKAKRPDAMKAWEQVGGREHLPAILASLESYRSCDDWRKDGGAFVPYPASWLRGRRWEDEVPVPGSNGHIDLSDAAF